MVQRDHLIFLLHLKYQEVSVLQSSQAVVKMSPLHQMKNFRYWVSENRHIGEMTLVIDIQLVFFFTFDVPCIPAIS